jgi:hypothetical protein
MKTLLSVKKAEGVVLSNSFPLFFPLPFSKKKEN